MKSLIRWVVCRGIAGSLSLSLSLSLGLALAPTARADVTNSAPDFHEVADLIRSNLVGVSDADLNQAEVRGLVDQLHGRVALVSGPNDTSPTPAGPVTVQAIVYDGGIATFRVSDVADGLAGKLAAAQKSLAATNTNTLKGLVLDLRYADGSDYQAAANTAGLFVDNDEPLLDWGAGTVKAKSDDHFPALPLIVLVNKQTAGAAEALAAILRQSDHAVILGGTTAGETMVGRNFPLKNGQYLRIAMADVKLADGQALTPAGVKPDISVAVKSEDERAYYDDPFKDIAGTGNVHGTNGPAAAIRRLSEADLIRERKERPGMDLEYMPLPEDTTADTAAAAARAAANAKPVVHDPVLARALDLVKGIAAFHPSRTP